MQLEELLTDSRESSDQPISIALAASLCTHALLIVSLALLLNSDSIPGSLTESPAISIFLVPRNSPIESGRDSDRATEKSELIEATLTMAGHANPEAGAVLRRRRQGLRTGQSQGTGT